MYVYENLKYCVINSPHTLGNKLLPRRLQRVEQSQTRQQPPLARRIRLQLSLLIHVQHHDAQVSSAAALLGLEQRLRDTVENVDGGRPVLRLDIAGGGDSRLLLRFVKVAIGDLFLQPGDDAVDFVGHGGRVDDTDTAPARLGEGSFFGVALTGRRSAQGREWSIY